MQWRIKMRDSNPSLSRKTRNRILSQHEGFVPRLLSIFSSLRSKSTKYRWTRLAAPSYASLQMGTPCSAVRIPHSLARCNKTRAFALVLALAESEGFEPSREFPPYVLSRDALSTTQPTLHDYSTVCCCLCLFSVIPSIKH